MKKWLSLFVLAFLALVLSACTANKNAGEEKPAETTTEEENEEVEVATEKILYLNNGNEPTSFDPSVGFDAVSWNALNNLMEGLVRLSKDHIAEPATAEKVDVSEDGLTYTFTIREDAKWSNGDPVLASDFVYGWLHMLNPETASPAAFLAYFIEGAEAYNNGEGTADAVAIKALEEKVFEVKLNAPTEAFLNIITNPSFFPVNEKVATENPTWFTEADTFVGNGPFKLASWEHDVSFSFAKNENYWDAGSVKLDKVEWAMVDDSNTEYQMYETGELDVSGVPSELADQLMSDPELKNEDQAGLYFYRFNVSQEPFTNKKIRQAFGLAVNQQEIVEFVTKNGEKPAEGFVPYGFIGPDGKEFRETAGKLTGFDAEKAKTLLAEGMAEEGYTALPEVVLTYSTSDVHKKIAEALQSKFKEVLGVDVKLQNVEASVFAAEQKEFKYQLSRSSFLFDYADPVNALESFITGSSMNRTTWSNPEYDKLITDIKNETDEAKRWEMLIQADAMLMEEMPVFPVHYYNQVTLEKSNVSGIVRHPVGYMDLKWADKE
ncbi:MULTISPECIES: peptide ABC transporter substrate-binding protein [Bacillaceae]|uniref:peptide ABC transporter substrate-binding protein n=1 Tax=Bacillaceae TaxID=186817 RepID=UPI0006FCFCA4|nr:MULTISPECIES: peptide ABC transporter substrate-binding protein [Bacillaceae]KQL34612.1 cytochrome C [Psychrobacillus sp. FJAT-21963]MDF2068264.1 peptide ABC transporter substrate-binding protein [Bacillus sp. Cr_A10]